MVGRSGRKSPDAALRLTAIVVPSIGPDGRDAISNIPAAAFVSLFQNLDSARCVPGASVDMHVVPAGSTHGIACTENRNTGGIDDRLYRGLYHDRDPRGGSATCLKPVSPGFQAAQTSTAPTKRDRSIDVFAA